MTQPHARPLDHAYRRGIVLQKLRVVFLPVPKTACTSILWALAEMAGFKASRFTASRGAEVTPSLTIHDISRWPERYRLQRQTHEWMESASADPAWFTFSVVREPTARLWSAWQSKLLLREPQFVRRFGNEDWFPRRPRQPMHLLRDFRVFVEAVLSGEARDPHWLPQSELLRSRSLRCDHVGTTDQLDATMKRLASHLGGMEVPPLRRMNETLLPAPWPVLPPGLRERVVDHYRGDYETFDLSEPGDDPAAVRAREEWHAGARLLTPFLEQIILRNQRVGRLHAALEDVTREQQRT